jgi:NAD(P)H-dependent FMN reductase
LEAARLLAPARVAITTIVDGSVAPHFNPDLEAGRLPRKAARWRELAASADGLILSCPEYAAGIPGAFKNALDWLVGDPQFYRKPVAIFLASERSLGAQDALRLVLATMSAEIIEPACICIPLLGKQVSPADLCSIPDQRGVISRALRAFADAIALRESAAQALE